MIFLYIAIVLLLIAAVTYLDYRKDRDQPLTVYVHSCIDGDTLRTNDGRHIRLRGIDAPELAQAPFGQIATTALETLLPTGTRIELLDPGYDRHQRQLAWVRLPDKSDVSERMAASGFALAWHEPGHKARRVRRAADNARRHGAGLWGLGGFRVAPAAFRAARNTLRQGR